MSLPSGNYPEASAELFCQRFLREARSPSHRVIPRFYQIVNISPGLEPDTPLPAPWGRQSKPLYFLSPATTQPVVYNGFVWTSYADGSRHSVRHFADGEDLDGGAQPRIWNGVVNMHDADGSVLVCKYRQGVCVSVTTRRSVD
jgi:hypothetical protein